MLFSGAIRTGGVTLWDRSFGHVAVHKRSDRHSITAFLAPEIQTRPIKWAKGSTYSVPALFQRWLAYTAASKLACDFVSCFHRRSEFVVTSLENARLPLIREFDDVSSASVRRRISPVSQRLS
jgi:hypothetical protein